MTKDNYFREYIDNYWTYDENEKVFSVGRVTVIYEEHLKELIDLVKVDGLPPFGTLLMLLAAAGVNAPNNYLYLVEHLKSLGDEGISKMAEEAGLLLQKIAGLSRSYKQGKNKSLLIRTLVRGAHNMINRKSANQVVEGFKKEGFYSPIFKRKVKKTSQSICNEIRILSLINRRFENSDAIANEMAGIYTLVPEDIETEEEATEGEAGIVEQMLTKHETSKSGALVERIWSSANIPMHHKVPSGQPFGGVADITNKGEFDKLLISEFANDDVTFVSRLANKEAMYFHREAPPTKSNQGRVILLDLSLKNWGTVRKLAFAIMVAIKHNPKSEYECETFGVGNRYYDFDLSDINGIIDAVQVLDASLSAVKGLEDFFDSVDCKEKEVFFISTKECYESLAVQKLIADRDNPFDYLIHPNMEGKVEVYKKFKRGKKLHQSFIIPLHKLWNEIEKKTIPVDADSYQGRVSKLMTPFNILLPSPANNKETLVCGSEVFKITSEGYLLSIYPSKETHMQPGWDLLHTSIPMGGLRCIGRERNSGNWIYITLKIKKSEITLLNVTKDKVQIAQNDYLSTVKNGNLFYDNFYFYYFNNMIGFRIEMHDTKVQMKLDHTQLSIIKEKYVKYQEQKSNVNRANIYCDTVFKNYNSVGVDVSGQLIINSTRLVLNANNILKFRHSKIKLVIHIEAVRNMNGDFVFPDGSMVTPYAGGVVRLRSGDSGIPDIHIISMIEYGLAATCNSDFSGNQRFYKYATTLWKRSAKTEPYFVESSDNLTIREDDVQISTNQEYRSIPMHAFYNSYIQKYIQHIRDYARKNHA